MQALAETTEICCTMYMYMYYYSTSNLCIYQQIMWDKSYETTTLSVVFSLAIALLHMYVPVCLNVVLMTISFSVLQILNFEKCNFRLTLSTDLLHLEKPLAVLHRL